jgi:Domain of unknown function (DUF397)
MWRRSSHCHTDQCVEVSSSDHGVKIRDTKEPDGPVLNFTVQEWRAFIQGAKDGEFDDLVT